MADYNAELRNYFEVAWREYERVNPGTTREDWYLQNANNLKNYFDALWAQKQGTSTPPSTTMSAPTSTTSPAWAPTSGQVDQLNAAIDQIAARDNVDRATAAAILRGDIDDPVTGLRTPAAGTGIPQNMMMKSGLDWETLAEQTRASKAQEDLIKQRLAFEQGVSLGKVGGQNTLESIRYANEILANPRNAALAEQVRKGYALGDIPGQTVSSYLARSVENPQISGAQGGAFYGFDTPQQAEQFAKEMTPALEAYKQTLSQQYGGQSINTEEASRRLGQMLWGVKQVAQTGPVLQEKLRKTPDDINEGDIRRLYYMVAGSANIKKSPEQMKKEILNMKFSTIPDEEGETELSKTLGEYQPEWVQAYLYPATVPIPQFGKEFEDWLYKKTDKGVTTTGTGISPGYNLPPIPTPAPVITPTPTPKQQAWAGTQPPGLRGGPVMTALTPIPNSSWASQQIPNWLGGRVHGGQITVQGEPHWIVDNQGNPRAAISEDGKKETIKGRGGIEVIPMTEPRKSQYMSTKKNVPGRKLGGKVNSRRTAPSRRLGSSAGNSKKTLSGTRANLPGGMVASTNEGIMDNRMNNGIRNNGRMLMTEMPMHRTTDKDAVSILPSTAKQQLMMMSKLLQQKMQMQPPQPVNITDDNGMPINTKIPGVFYTPIPGGQGGTYYTPVQRAQQVSGLSPEQFTKQTAGLPSRDVYGQRYYQNINAAGQAEESLADFNRRMDTMAAQEARGRAGEAAVGRYQPGPSGSFDSTVRGQGRWARMKANIDAMGMGKAIPYPEVGLPATGPMSAAGLSPESKRNVATPPISQITGMPIAPAATGLIASGGARVIGNNILGPQFGFMANAPSYIAGQNAVMGVKNLPGVYVRTGWKFNPRTLQNMTTEDRQLLESYISGTGQEPSTFYEQARYAEPGQAVSSTYYS